MHRRPAPGYDVFASTAARSHLDATDNGLQFRVAVHAQTSEFLHERTKSLSPRSVQQTDHVQPPNLAPIGRTALALSASPLVHRVVEPSIPDPGRHYCRLAEEDP